jgi:hypothetical protein
MNSEREQFAATVRQYGTVARAYTTDERSRVLTWFHHLVAAPVEDPSSATRRIVPAGGL